jgi:hypothetical protein
MYRAPVKQCLFLSAMNSSCKLFLLLLTFFASGLYAQQKEKKDEPLIQFSGRVLDQDSLTPIPFVSILIKGTHRGAVSDYLGFFSLVLVPGDELEFFSVTHKNRTYKVPDTLGQKYYFAIQVLSKDTIQLPPVEIYPWPSKDDFKRAFLALNLNETDAQRADQNLQREALTYLERNQAPSAELNYRYVMENYYTKIYAAGQQPSITLLNPIKWAEFIDAWRKGKLGKKK